MTDFFLWNIKDAQNKSGPYRLAWTLFKINNLYATEDSHSGLEQHEGKLMMTILILNL